MYEEEEKDDESHINPDMSFAHATKYQISVLERESHMLAAEADSFLTRLETWLDAQLDDRDRDETNNATNLDERMKTFCLEVIEAFRRDAAEENSKSEEESEKRRRFREQVLASKRKIYATIYVSVYLIFKSTDLNDTFELSRFRFERGNSHHCQYFIFRIMTHKELDENNSDFDKYFTFFIKKINKNKI